MSNRILSLGFIISIIILLLNDHYLKYHYPNFITGKLSDFAGLFAFPFFWTSLFQKCKKQVYLLTALLFIFWKLPSSSTFIDLWNTYLPYRINRVVDYTDFLGLFILPVSYFYRPKIDLTKGQYRRKVSLIMISIVTLFSFVSTVGTHGNIKRYYLNYSKYKVNQALRFFFKEHPQYLIPSGYKYEVWHYGSVDTKDKWVMSMNADSVNSHFYLKKHNLVFWSVFSQRGDNWYEPSCQLVLIGYLDSLGYWNYDDDLWWYEEDNIIDLFEAEIMSKLILILEANDFKDETYKRHKPLKDDP